ncbi:MAG: S41 family peptidase [Rikenellaceae bacterium]|nr:S41 family peptidase [Rikenellaceae bacterium]
MTLMDILNRYRGVVVRWVLVVAAVAISPVVRGQGAERICRDFELGRASEILVNIMRELESGFVDEVAAEELLEAAAGGMISATDPYSEYLSESDMAGFEIMTTGRYGGVGSLIRKRGDYVIFAQPYKGSPSDVAGVKIGDKILAIDGVDMRGATTESISSRLKGEPQTDVEVVIERNIGGTVDTLMLRRERISIPSVDYAGIIRDGIGYISHDDFIEGSYEEMRRAVEALVATDSLRGLILDYRANGGGVMQEAVDIASLFVPRGERIVSIMGRDSSSLEHYNTRYTPIAESIPIVVLVSGSSASASEILAGALQDIDRAVVMGSRTYGKGLVQGTRYLGYNSYLKYTTAKYYIPSGRCIQSRNYTTGSVTEVADSLITEFRTRGGRKVYDGGGITPDVKIEPQYISRFALTLYAMGFTEDWADEYMRRNHDKSIDIRTFSITDEDYADFCRFIADKDVPYESETRVALGKLEKAAKNDLYDERLDEAIERLKALVKDDKMSNMETYRSDIVDALNADIILRYAYRSGAKEHAAANDEVVDRAVELLLDSEEYERILREQSISKN